MGNNLFNIDDIAGAIDGTVLSRAQTTATSVGTDTRSDLSGKLFIPLKGEKFDAHQFISKAAAGGASLILSHQEVDKEVLARAGVIRVRDTLPALQELGLWWRRKMRAKIIGITGSNGKTTSKEFTAAVLSSKFKVTASRGSFNNHWGVPLSLLSIRPEDEVAVIEMGMNHLGELKFLSRLVEANAVVVTNVARAHLEGLQSIDGIARAKAEIYEYAPPNCAFVFNLDDPRTAIMAKAYRRNLEYCFSSQDRFDVAVHMRCLGMSETSLRLAGRILDCACDEIEIPVFGKQNVVNLMVAACFALHCGMKPDDIWANLPRCRTIWGRNQWVNTQSGARVLFDGYNANPDSMQAALDNFRLLRSASGGRKIALLGEMRELGQASDSLHDELAATVFASGFDWVGFVGDHGAAFAAKLRDLGFKNKIMISKAYENNLALKWGLVLDPKDLVLMKGSRGVELEKLLAELQPVQFSSK